MKEGLLFITLEPGLNSNGGRRRLQLLKSESARLFVMTTPVCPPQSVALDSFYSTVNSSGLFLLNCQLFWTLFTQLSTLLDSFYSTVNYSGLFLLNCQLFWTLFTRLSTLLDSFYSTVMINSSGLFLLSCQLFWTLFTRLSTLLDSFYSTVNSSGLFLLNCQLFWPLQGLTQAKKDVSDGKQGWHSTHHSPVPGDAVGLSYNTGEGTACYYVYACSYYRPW